jgi:hypothetical protein
MTIGSFGSVRPPGIRCSQWDCGTEAVADPRRTPLAPKEWSRNSRQSDRGRHAAETSDAKQFSLADEIVTKQRVDSLSRGR